MGIGVWSETTPLGVILQTELQRGRVGIGSVGSGQRTFLVVVFLPILLLSYLVHL